MGVDAAGRPDSQTGHKAGATGPSRRRMGAVNAGISEAKHAP